MTRLSIQLCVAASLGVFAAGTLSPCAEAQAPTRTPSAAIHWIPNSNTPRAGAGFHPRTFMRGLSLPGKHMVPPKISADGKITPNMFDPTGLGYAYGTPQSTACVYGLVPTSYGCNPFEVTATPSSAKPLAIALVDAYHNPTAQSDLDTFSNWFGLPNTSSGFVTQVSTSTVDTTGWGLESSLDIEWAHAMSPTAKIFLVEASDEYDLFNQVATAAQLVSSAGGGIVSMSWGGYEDGSILTVETYLQSLSLAYPTVTFLASSGDSPGVSYPSSSQYVVAVGGTSVSTNLSNANFLAEQTWTEGGGGVSYYIPMPTFQNSIKAKLAFGGQYYRGVPDIAAVANPDTGVWVYNATWCPQYTGSVWCVMGGTSVASPVSAGILSWKGIGTTKSQQILSEIYTSTAFRDITYGDCGPYVGWKAASGWDYCTGKGSIAAKTTKLVVSGGYAP